MCQNAKKVCDQVVLKSDNFDNEPIKCTTISLNAEKTWGTLKALLPGFEEAAANRDAYCQGAKDWPTPWPAVRQLVWAACNCHCVTGFALPVVAAAAGGGGEGLVSV